MRFVELDLVRYGQFQDCRLSFRAGKPDFHIIFGLNEAGKSTTLAAVSDLLFGFSGRTNYAFRFDAPLLRVGAVIEDNAQQFAFRRKKGNKATVLDADENSIDDTPLLTMLHGQDRDIFRLGWSLDHHRLREGGQAIVDAKDDVGRALFAAGSGITGTANILQALKDEADGIWAKRFSERRSYSRAERDYKEAKTRLRQSQLQPSTWKSARDDLERLQEGLSGHEVRRIECHDALRKVERLRRAIGPVRQRQNALEALTASNAVVLAPVVEQAAQVALEKAAEAERKRSIANDLLAERREKLAALKVDNAVLAANGEIAALPDSRGAVHKGLFDLPRLEAELLNRQRRIDELRAELGLALGEDKHALPSRLTVSNLRRLIAQRVKLEAEISGLDEAANRRTAQREQIATQLAGAPTPESLDELQSAVRLAERLGDIDNALHEQERLVEKAGEECAQAFARLKPWAGDAAVLATLVLPGDEEIDAAKTALNNAATEEAEGAREIKACQQTLEHLKLEHEGLAAAGQAVSAETLGAARNDRDTGWLALKRQITAPEPTPVTNTEIDHFEALIEKVDTVSDLRFASARESAELSQNENRQRQYALQLEQGRFRLDAAKRMQQQVHSNWAKRLEHLGIPTLAPTEIRDWASRRQIALEKSQAKQNADEQRSELALRRAQACGNLRNAMGEVEAMVEISLQSILERGQGRLTAANKQSTDIERLKQQLESAESEVDDVKRQLNEKKAEKERWRGAWDAAVREVGFALPPDNADAHLQMCEEMRTEADKISELARRIESIRRDEITFNARVHDLAQRLGENINEHSVRQVVDNLLTRLTKAHADAQANGSLKDDINTRNSELRQADAELQAAEASLAGVREATGTTDRLAVAGAIAASQERRALQNKLLEFEEEISAQSDGVPLKNLIDACLHEDPDALAKRSESLSQDLKQLDDTISEVTHKAALAQKNFEIMDSGPKASDAAADMEQALAEMTEQAEAYLLKRAQFLLLRQAIERYREERQNPLLLRAGELFKILTLGRYKELRVDFDGPEPRLLGLGEGGQTAVGIDEMSDGTIDQLFLALRVAAIEDGLQSHVALPFLADDLFINFDNERARAGFRVLGELAQSTQVLFFTHHSHLLALAEEALGKDGLTICELK